MKKILALDLGDKWVGSAISDALGITCKPLETVELSRLEAFLQKVLPEHNIDMVIVGYPKTFAGAESAQTKKIVIQKEALEEKFSSINGKSIEWILWDERLSSKRAEAIRSAKAPTPEGKRKSHSRAAAFILQSYLDFLAFKNS